MLRCTETHRSNLSLFERETGRLIQRSGGTKHGSSQSYAETIRDGNRQTGGSAASERDKHITKQPYTSTHERNPPNHLCIKTAGTLQPPKIGCWTLEEMAFKLAC